jgi:hypothetical protein
MCVTRDKYVCGFDTGFKQRSEGRKSLLHPRLKSPEYIQAPYIRGIMAGMHAAEVYATQAYYPTYLVIPIIEETCYGNCVFCRLPELYTIPEMFRKKPTVVLYTFPQLPVPSFNSLRVPSL